jgi:SAM-dependent methyltransferase
MAALDSYETFARLKREGQVPPACRFLVSLPTPVAPVSAFVAMEDQAQIEPIYEAQMLEEVRQMVDGIPHDQMAIQWDARYEIAMLDGAMGVWFDDVRAGVLERLARLGAQVPGDVELGYHLCYGDDEHGHFVEPQDSGPLVDVANGLVSALDRPLDFLHIPVPAGHDGDAYFAPLGGLSLADETELYLGLLHPSDGAEGAARRTEAARRHVAGFGVATECGWGRGGAAAVTGLLELHREASAPLPDRVAPEPRPVWPEGFVPVRDEDWATQEVDAGGVGYDHVEGHGWYANLNPTVEELVAELEDGDVLLDYSGGTGILLDRLRLRIFDRQIATVIADTSPTFLRVALEKHRGDPLVALRLLGELEEVLGPELTARGVDAIACTNAIHLYPDFPGVAAAWERVLRPGRKAFINSGNLKNPHAGDSEWLIGETVGAINEQAQGLVRSDRTYERYLPLLEDRELLERHAAIRKEVFLDPRPLSFYVAGLEDAGLRVRDVRETTIEASVHEWFDFLSAFHGTVLGWIPEERVHDRLRLMRHAMEMLFAQRPTFKASWTYITAEKP